MLTMMNGLIYVDRFASVKVLYCTVKQYLQLEQTTVIRLVQEHEQSRELSSCILDRPLFLFVSR